MKINNTLTIYCLLDYLINDINYYSKLDDKLKDLIPEKVFNYIKEEYANIRGI